MEHWREKAKVEFEQEMRVSGVVFKILANVFDEALW